MGDVGAVEGLDQSAFSVFSGEGLPLFDLPSSLLVPADPQQWP